MISDVIWLDALTPYLVDLAPRLETEAQQYYQAIIENNTVAGRLVALPWTLDIGMLFYRADLLRKYRFSMPPRPGTSLSARRRRSREVGVRYREMSPVFFEGVHRILKGEDAMDVLPQVERQIQRIIR